MTRTYKQPCIEHITEVGTHKAAGLLSYREIKTLGYVPGALAKKFRQSAEYRVLEIESGEISWGHVTTAETATLAIAHLPTLKKWLDLNADTVAKNGWPTDPAGFFDKSLAEFHRFDHDKPETVLLERLLTSLYNQPHHPGKKPERPHKIK